MDKVTLKVIRKNLKSNNLNDLRNEKFWNDMLEVCQLDYLQSDYYDFSNNDQKRIDKILSTYAGKQLLFSVLDRTKRMIQYVDYPAQILDLSGSHTHYIIEFLNKYKSASINKNLYKEDENKVIAIITNQLDWEYNTIAELYKKRWYIELFFKSLK